MIISLWRLVARFGEMCFVGEIADMSLKILVMVKQVPDTRNITSDAMKEDGTVNREALEAVFNPDDMHALEAALCVKDEYPQTKIVVLTMGPLAAVEVLKESLYRGADEVALISDRAFAGADTLATSYALAQAIQNKIGDYDFIFCGRQAIDGDTAQVGPQTAEKLNINQITCITRIEHIDTEERLITASRVIDGGNETVRCSWPVLLTFTSGEYRLRPPALKRVMANKNMMLATKEERFDESYMNAEKNVEHIDCIPLWDVHDIGADPEKCGLLGSPTKVRRIDWVVLKPCGIKMVENSDQALKELVHDLVFNHTLD